MSGFGADFKDNLGTPGDWGILFVGIGEMLPNEKNRMCLDADQKDKWGMPRVTFDVEKGENEHLMRKSISQDMAEMYEAAGFKNIRPFDFSSNPSMGIHEMGQLLWEKTLKLLY